MVVLGYIHADTKRFHVYVANRVAQIRKASEPSSWHHVVGKENPADIASRGVRSVSQLLSSTWFTGPTFLHQQPLTLPSCIPIINPEDPEVKSSCLTTKTPQPSEITTLLQRFSSFQKLVSFVAVMHRFISFWKAKVMKIPPVALPLTVEDHKTAERHLAGLIQKENQLSPTTPSLKKLDPFLDASNLLRVGGRFRRIQRPETEIHPVILPKHSFFSRLVVLCAHDHVKHQGRTTTVNRVRQMGYWIPSLNQLVKTVIRFCVTCIRFRGAPQSQKMSDLPPERITQSSPFDYTGMDFFGPFEIKEGRKTLKRYGVVFTCLYSRSIHLETATALSTDAFLNALRRFFAVRGPVRLLRCDQGTNFIGVGKQLDMTKVKQHLVSQTCDFEISFNPPSSPHRGGIWERMVGSVKRILEVILFQNGTQLDDDSFRTFLAEIMYLINSRPLSLDNLNDPTSTNPITPNHLLTMKSQVLLPPPTKFVKEDVYSIKRWRRVQHLANVFWSKFKSDYIGLLISRSKWTKTLPNLKLNDIVLVNQDFPRAKWPLAIVVEATPDSDGLVRQVKLRLSGKNRFLHRPVQKLVLVLSPP